MVDFGTGAREAREAVAVVAHAALFVPVVGAGEEPVQEPGRPVAYS